MNKPSALSEPASVSTEPTAAHRGPSPVTANGRAFTPREFAFLIGVPLSWGVLLLFHPSCDGKEIYLQLQDKVTPWMVVHIGQMFFIPLMAIVVDLLLRGVEGGAARVSRIALVPFVVFYTAFELLQGLGNGILVNAVNGLPQAERATGAALVQDFSENVLIRDLGVFVSIGSLGLITAAITAGIALYRHAGAPLSVPILLGLAGFLITAHPPPFGPTGLALFVIAVLLYRRSRSGVQVPASLGPSPA
jgi:hypothetical protein